jgi:hypothetical protein
MDDLAYVPHRSLGSSVSCRLADWVISRRGEERKRRPYSSLCAQWPRFACAFADAHGFEVEREFGNSD